MPKRVIKTAEELENLAWEQFLSTHSRTGRMAYDARRRCSNCRSPIVNTNKTGFCHKCLAQADRRFRHNKNPRTANRTSEGQGHQHLKTIAIAFLEKHGYSNIDTEVKFGERPVCYIEADVAATKNNKPTIIECGGSLRRKLLKAKGFVNEIYILPYGETKPFIWNEDIIICNNCGHITGTHAKNVKPEIT